MWYQWKRERFLKICLSVQSLSTKINLRKPEKYLKGIAVKQFQESGTKKLFILGTGCDCQEIFNKIMQLFYSLNTNTFTRIALAKLCFHISWNAMLRKSNFNFEVSANGGCERQIYKLCLHFAYLNWYLIWMNQFYR